MLWSDLCLRIENTAFIKSIPAVSIQSMCSYLDRSLKAPWIPTSCQRTRGHNEFWPLKLNRKWQKLLFVHTGDTELSRKYRWSPGHSLLGISGIQKAPITLTPAQFYLKHNFKCEIISTTTQLIWSGYIFFMQKMATFLKTMLYTTLFRKLFFLIYLALSTIYLLVNPKFLSPALTTHLNSRPIFQ